MFATSRIPGIPGIPHPRRGYGYGDVYGYNHIFVSSALPMKRNNLYNKRFSFAEIRASA
jgi:hypothetical protein